MPVTTNLMSAPETALPPTHATNGELATLIELAAQTVAPLWPLDSAIAVNPLSGFEELPFEQALEEAATLFGARRSLPLAQWRALLDEGKIDTIALHKAAVAALGGLEPAFAPLGPDLNAFDLLRARLVALPVEPAGARTPLAPGLAVLTRWLAAFFDRAPKLPLQGRERGLYPCLAEQLAQDPALLALATPSGRSLIGGLPSDPLTLISLTMAIAGVEPSRRHDHLRQLIALLPGWAGHLRWRIEHGGPAAMAGAPATMTELIALIALVRCATGADRRRIASDVARNDSTAALLAHFGLERADIGLWTAEARSRLEAVARLDDAELGLIFQQAAEIGYVEALLPRIAAPAAPAPAPRSDARPAAQLVFCIDVRSEPMRRAIEAQGRYETLGYAGFFGLPIAIDHAGHAAPRNQLPVLLQPAHVVAERPVPGCEAEAEALLARHDCLHGARHMLDVAKSGATGFAAAEAAGPLAALAMLARTVAPHLVERLHATVLGKREAVLAPACNDHDPDMTLAQKVGYARGLFALTGLTAQTARLLVLVGHGGCTTNNAFAASLDCGACGGHPGGPNARLMAALLNDPAVRAGLAAEGLDLPADSVVVAAQHDTTRDIVTLFDTGQVPPDHAADVARLREDLARAGTTVREARSATLGRPASDLLIGALHWAEVRPEWGLSGNAAFIVGPRSLTREADLAGTAFLHSYDWQRDPDGAALTTIMTAPMIVAQWINAQYLFSTLDNDAYGAGDKATQNVVGGIGVVQGAGGDLCTGLPRQSLYRDDGRPFHIPRRLTVVIEAPPQRVQRIVLAHDGVARLVENGWINLVVIDPWKRKAQYWQRGAWHVRPC